MEEAERFTGFTGRWGKFLQLWGEPLEMSDVQSGKNLDTGQRDKGLKERINWGKKKEKNEIKKKNYVK